MPVGLMNAPAVIQALINVFRDILNKYVFVYPAKFDIFIWLGNPCETCNGSVLQRLFDHQLYVKAEKCEFLESAVLFLS